MTSGRWAKRFHAAQQASTIASFVAVKEEAQLDMQTMHRARSTLLSEGPPKRR